MQADALRSMLHRSDELHHELLRRVEGVPIATCERSAAVSGMCSVSLEHAFGLRTLLAIGCCTPAIALLRLQFESLTRAMWAHYVAQEAEIAKLNAPLTLDSEQAAKNLPSVLGMVEEIGKGAGTKVPAKAYQMLAHFKDMQWKSLNSFVHGGIHPLRRQVEGYPVQLILEVLRSSNGLATMAGMTLALLTGDRSVAQAMGRIQPEFQDCLPALQTP